ncbi:MAG: MucR family transcriptional regulator [Nitrospiraceae bacterium]|jgi:predicted transcriptional regulator|nr:MucR family transcriptional regulator [Nitrospiraceae bacterium]
MSDSTDHQTIDFIDLTRDLAAAYVANNSVPISELPGLIQGLHAALTRLGQGRAEPTPEETHEKPTSAQIRKSVTPDGLVSFLDGRTYKTLKRHLTGHGLDPVSYRQRYGLPADYPMVAASYAAQRSALAKSIGLGRVADRDEETKAKGRGKAA